MDDIAVEVAVFDNISGSIRTVSGDALSVRELGSFFTHGLGKAEDAFLGRVKSRADSAPTFVGDDRIVLGTDVEDLSAARGYDDLVVAIRT